MIENWSIFQNQSSQTFKENTQFVQICFVFRMYVFQIFVRDGKLSFSKRKTDKPHQGRGD
jgi:hypothetical protein